MEKNSTLRIDHELVPEIDEGWWASVLADESAQSDEVSDLNCKPCNQPSSAPLDWDCVRSIYERDEVVLLAVYGFNRGGLLVQGEGIQGFVPVSHLVDVPANISDTERHTMLSEYVGKSLYLKVIECEPTCDRVVFSERAAQAGEGKRKELFESLRAGLVICGVITNVTEFGAFVDLGGVEGLIHVSELSWGRVDNPENFLKVGQQVKVMVLSVNEENSRIALSMKRLEANPWDELISKYSAGDVIDAQITTILKFGAFARLEEGVEGLIHVSSITQSGDHPHLESLFTPGQKVSVKILHIDAERRRLGLGLVSSE